MAQSTSAFGKHREGQIRGHTQRYNIKTLVYVEGHGALLSAIAREKKLKRWRRDWKTEPIEAGNPTWRDLWYDLVELPELDPLRFPPPEGNFQP